MSAREISSKVNRQFKAIFCVVFGINENRRHFGLRRREKNGEREEKIEINAKNFGIFITAPHTQIHSFQELRLCKIITINSRFSLS